MKSKPRDSGRNAQLVRTLNILFDLMCEGRASLDALAKKHGTSERTIQRDLDALRSAGLPVEAEKQLGDKRNYWTVNATAQTRRFNKLMNEAHFLALVVAMSQRGALHEKLGIFDVLVDLHGKIADALGKGKRRQLKASDNAFIPYDKYPYTLTPPVLLRSLVTGIAERTRCLVTYRKPQHESTDEVFEILPLKIFMHNGGAYLMCHALERNAIRTLNLMRVRALKLTDKRAEVPEGFDPNALEHSAFGVHTGGEPTRYVLQFAAEVAGYIRERSWHPSQELRELPAGRVQLSFECGESYEVSAWVASWRHWVRVVKPQALRRELRELGESLAAQYRGA